MVLRYVAGWGGGEPKQEHQEVLCVTTNEPVDRTDGAQLTPDMMQY